MNRPTLPAVLEAFGRLGYRLFNDGRLNVAGIRAANPRAGSYDDWIFAFWTNPPKEGGFWWDSRAWVATTDPGLYYLRDHLINPDGCAILVPGHYAGTFAIDKHRGLYRALCQRNGPVQVYRDRTRDGTLDTDPATIAEGMFGINIHYDSAQEENKEGGKVYKASAGCQVFASREDFRQFMKLAEASAERWGNRFDYTLLTEDQLQTPEAARPEPTLEAADSHETAPLEILPRGKDRFGLLERWDTMTINAGTAGKAAQQVELILSRRDAYESAAEAAGGCIPWYLIGCVHHLESSGRWDCHLHNGDPLKARTYHAPAGRPAKGNPPFTWQESAADALRLDSWNCWESWTLAEMLDRLEKYNGTGYRQFHKDCPSPYLWAGSNHYRRGKYGSDGKWDPELISKQIGAAVLLKVLFERLRIAVEQA